MLENKYQFLFLFFLIIFGVVGIKALFHQGYYTSHDGWHQVVRLYYFDRLVRSGKFPPSYVKDLFYGYGYPLFIFNYHLPWIIAEPFTLVGFSVFDSIKAVYILGFIISGITMFIWLRNHFGDFESFVGSFLYMWAPYRFSNIFVRGATGEATVFIFIPLLFLTIDLLKKKFNWPAIVLGAISIGGIIISHAIIAFLLLSLSSVYFLTSIFSSRDKIRYFFRLIFFVFLGLMLVSYYLMPSITLKKYTKFDQNITVTKNGDQFVTFKELFYSKWGYSFATPRSPDSMSFQLGIAQWFTISFIGFILIIKILKGEKIKDKDFLISLLIFFSLSILLITPYSQIFWKNFIDRLFIIDFPWRLLTLAVFASSALSGYLLSLLSRPIKLLIGSFLIMVAVYTNRNHLRVNQYTNIPLSLYLASEITANAYDEYLPKWVNPGEVKKIKKGGQIFSDQNINIFNVDNNKVNHLSFNYESSTVPDFTVHLFYFPGWQVLIDKKPVDFSFDDLGLIKFKGLKGKHEVVITYSGTKLTKISSFISFLTLLVIIFPKKLFLKTKIK